MKKTRKIFTLLLLLVMMFSQLHFTVVRGNYTGEQLLIPVTINWDGNADSPASRPASVTVTLYKYLGSTFNQATAIVVGTPKTVTAADDWKCTFDISDEPLYSGTTYSPANAYNFKVVQSAVSGYQTEYTTDPDVTFNPPDIAGDWVRMTPCCELDIVTVGASKSIVVMKKGNSCTVWSIDRLSENEKQIIIRSAKDGINGIGNPTFNFCYGLGTLPCGMTVTENMIHFENHSDWSFFAVGTYNKSSSLANGALITNTKNTYGNLTVTKTVDGNAADTNKDFSFTITLNDGTIDGVFGALTFVNGVASFTLKHGQSITAEGLPNGVGYTVEETDYSADGYVTTKTSCLGTIEGDQTQLVAFTNTRNADGTLTISKALAGNAITEADKAIDFKFVVTLSDKTINGVYSGVTFTNGVSDVILLKCNESKTIEGLPNGVGYTVSESDYGEFVPSSTGAQGNISENQPMVAAFTNTKDTFGNLIVGKTVAGNDADTTKKFTFTVTLNDPTINGVYGSMNFTSGVASFTLADQESVEAVNLPNGITYTVVETDADGYEVTIPANYTGTIVGKSTINVDFVNTRNTYGRLIVYKYLEGNAVDVTKDFSFTVALSDQTINGQYGLMNFQNGVANFTLKGGEWTAAKDLPNGIAYTVTEADYSADGYVTTMTGNTGTIIGDDLGEFAVAAIFTNTRNAAGSLTIAKVLEGNDVEVNKDFEFTITLSDTTINGTFSDLVFNNGVASFTLHGGESKTIEGLPNGVQYTIVETDYSASGYITTKIGDTGTIDENSPKAATFTNTRNTYGSLTVNKTLAGNAADATKNFNFTVTLGDPTVNGVYGAMTFNNGVATFTLKGGESITATNLPNGATYTVAEEDYLAEGYLTVKTNDVGIIIGNQTITASFTNTRNAVGTLTITKNLEGNDVEVNKDFEFTITLTDLTISGVYGEVTFANGIATFTLKGGQSKVVENLPNGVGYIVAEKDYSLEGYTTTSTGTVGTISETVASATIFTNTRNSYGDLRVMKMLAGNATDADKDFIFIITLSDKTINGFYGGMEFINGVSKHTLKGGQWVTAVGLPNGITYTVDEHDYTADGYVVTIPTNYTGTIVGDQLITTVFSNTRDVYSNLTIRKTVTGEVADMEKYFTFTVTFDAVGSYEYIGSKSGTISSGDTIKLKHNEEITIISLPVGTTYSVTESDNAHYTVTATGDSGVIQENVVSIAHFTNCKTPVPHTGDNTNIYIWIAVMLLSVSVITALEITKRKVVKKIDKK